MYAFACPKSKDFYLTNETLHFIIVHPPIWILLHDQSNPKYQYKQYMK